MQKYITTQSTAFILTHQPIRIESESEARKNTPEELINNFCDKQNQEQRDTIAYDILGKSRNESALFVCRQDRNRLHVRKNISTADSASARPGYTDEQVIAECKPILKAGFENWGKPVTLSTPWIQQALAFLRATERFDAAKHLEDIVIKRCLIRAGPAITFFGANHQSQIFIADDISDTEAAAKLIHEFNALLNPEAAHQENEVAEIRFRVWEALQAGLESKSTQPIKSIASEYPIFTRGWLAEGLNQLPQDQQAVLKPIIEQLINETRKSKKVVTVIPVGGRGSRFAPFSWAILKPFCKLFGKSNLIYAVERTLTAGTRHNDIFFFIEEEMIEPAKEELKQANISIPDENFISEAHGILKGKPVALEKAAMFAIAAVYIEKLRGPDTVIVFERTDLVLKGKTKGDTESIMQELGSAIDKATTIVALEPTVGILGDPPTDVEKDKLNPDLNKGYIFPYSRKAVNPVVEGVQAVSKFHEKPKTGEGNTKEETGEEIARRYITQGATYNASYFIFRVDTVLKTFKVLRPEEYTKLMQLSQSVGTHEEKDTTQEVYDYFVQPERCLSFERAIVEGLAPVKGEIVSEVGLAVASFGKNVAKNWVSSQGTLKAVWPQEKKGKNYIRAEGLTPEELKKNIKLTDEVKGCNIMLAPTDNSTKLHIFGATNLSIGYENTKRALIVAPVVEAKQVSSITKAVKKAPSTYAFVEPNQHIPQSPREIPELIEDTTSNNSSILANNGFATILNSKNTTIYSQEGIIGVTHLEDTIVIKVIEEGEEHIYVYGPQAQEQGEQKLSEISNKSIKRHQDKKDPVVYVFDYDYTLANPNELLNRPISDMPYILSILILKAKACIASVKSLEERDELVRKVNNLLIETLEEIAPDETERYIEEFEFYLDKTSTHYINRQGKLEADKKYHVGINKEQLEKIKAILKERLGIPEEMIIDYPGSIKAQFKITDSWKHKAHAVVYYHPVFGDIVKVMVKPYGWAEEEYSFEEAPSNPEFNPKGRKTRVELAKELTVRLRKEKGLKRVYAEKGGKVVLDITGADKSRMVRDLYDRGYRKIKYYGDDPEGNDKAVFDLAKKIKKGEELPGLELEAILVKNPQDTYNKILQEELVRLEIKKLMRKDLERFTVLKKKDKLTPELTNRLAIQAAERFMGYYLATGKILRDTIELITDIATLEDSHSNKPGIRELFASVVEKLNNSYTLENRLTYYKVFAQVIQYCRQLPEAKDLNKKLNTFGLTDEASLVTRTMRIREVQAFDKSQSQKVKKVFILSRVTIGADIAVTSIAFEKIRRVFPEAEIIFLASPINQTLFGSNPKIRIKPLKYERKGGLVGRLNTWLNVLETIKEETKDNEPYIILDPDTRLTQVGLLPLTAQDKSYFFFEADFTSRPLALDFADWLNKTFGTQKHEVPLYPSLYLQETDLTLAKTLFRKFKLEDKYVVGLHLGTGGVLSKMVSIPFETELIQTLIQEGTTIVLYRGVNEKEEERTTQIISALKEKGISLAEVEQDKIEEIKINAQTAQVIVFSKTNIGLSAAILGRCQQVVCYSSSSKHIAGTLRVPTTVIYIREASFVDKWVPYTSSPMDIVRITPKEKLNEARTLRKVMESVRAFL